MPDSYKRNVAFDVIQRTVDVIKGRVTLTPIQENEAEFSVPIVVSTQVFSDDLAEKLVTHDIPFVINGPTVFDVELVVSPEHDREKPINLKFMFFHNTRYSGYFEAEV